MLFFEYNFEYYSTMLTLVLFLQYYNLIFCYTVVPRLQIVMDHMIMGLVHILKWETTCVEITGVGIHTISTKYIFEAVITKLLFAIFRCVLLLRMQAYVAGIQNKDSAAHTFPNLYSVEASITFRHNFKIMNSTHK
jgi:hypothetical protein